MDPSIGRIVHYRLDDGDVATIRRRRQSANGLRRGNPVHVGESVPLVVTAVQDDGSVNGQALLGGDDALWITFAEQGDAHGRWSWPPRV